MQYKLNYARKDILLPSTLRQMNKVTRQHWNRVLVSECFGISIYLHIMYTVLAVDDAMNDCRKPIAHYTGQHAVSTTRSTTVVKAKSKSVGTVH